MRAGVQRRVAQAALRRVPGPGGPLRQLPARGRTAAAAGQQQDRPQRGYPHCQGTKWLGGFWAKVVFTRSRSGMSSLFVSRMNGMLLLMLYIHCTYTNNI